MSGGSGTKTRAPVFNGSRSTFRSLHRVDELYADHDPRTAIIVGSGPSLRNFPWEQLDRSRFFRICINREVQHEEFPVDVWIWYDAQILKDYRNFPVSKETKVLTRPPMVHSMVHGHTPKSPVPDWGHRIYMFETTRTWTLDHPSFYMHRTTAVPALILAVRMGFKRILLLGLDCYTEPELYYHTGEKPQSGRRKRAIVRLQDGAYAEDRHVQMMTDFTKVGSMLTKAQWPGRIIQCSVKSPMSCFEKMPWERAAQRDS